MDEGTGLESIRTAARGRGESGRESQPGRATSPLVYRTGDVVQILGISRRQLQYWAQTDLIVPSEKTPGGHHRYTFEDLVALKATKRLIDAGVSVQRIRSSIRALRHMLPRVERPLSELTLVATGDVVLVFHEGSAFEAVTGQEWVFQVAQFEREIAAWRRRHGPPDPAEAGSGPDEEPEAEDGAGAVHETARPVPASEGGTA
jgi:DNA-binding transcriptional MerR regulator